MLDGSTEGAFKELSNAFLMTKIRKVYYDEVMHNSFPVDLQMKNILHGKIVVRNVTYCIKRMKYIYEQGQTIRFTTKMVKLMSLQLLN